MRKLFLFITALTLSAGLWAQDSVSRNEATNDVNNAADAAITEVQKASSTETAKPIQDKAIADINETRDAAIWEFWDRRTMDNDVEPVRNWAIGQINSIKYRALDDIKATDQQTGGTFKQDTVRIHNDILIIDEVYNPKTLELEGWSYNSHNDGEMYTFIRTNQTQKFGTFSIADGTVDTVGNYNIVEFVIHEDTVSATFIEGKMTIAEIGDSIILDGNFVGDDGRVYLFHCTHLTDAINADTDMDMEQEYEYYQMFSYIEDGVATIEVGSKTTTVTLELNVGPTATSIPAGTYVLSDTHETSTANLSTGVEIFEPQPCFAGTVDILTGQIRDFFFMTEGSVTIQYDEYNKMNVVIDTKNSYNRYCHMTVTYHHVVPVDTITIDQDVEFTMAVNPLTPQFYMCQIFEQTEPLAALLIRTKEIQGNFTKEMCLPGSLIQTPRDGYIRNLIDFVQCTVTKDEKDMQIETRFIANDSILYIIRGTGYEDALIGDAKTDYEGHFLIQDISRKEIMGDTCIFYAVNEVGDHINFAFVANFSEDNTIIPDSYTNIVPGGDVVLDKGRLPSYIDTPDGSSWYIQSGMMTVEADGSMAFEGLNSYDKKVVFTISAQSTDLEPVNDAQCTMHTGKFIHNGQLIIRKCDKNYTVLGGEVNI